MRLGSLLKVEAKRWPWQEQPTSALGLAMDRFGGGWAWKLGVDVSRPQRIGGFVRWEMVVNLVFGMVRITWRPRLAKEPRR